MKAKTVTEKQPPAGETGQGSPSPSFPAVGKEGLGWLTAEQLTLLSTSLDSPATWNGLGSPTALALALRYLPRLKPGKVFCLWLPDERTLREQLTLLRFWEQTVPSLPPLTVLSASAEQPLTSSTLYGLMQLAPSGTEGTEQTTLLLATTAIADQALALPATLAQQTITLKVNQACSLTTLVEQLGNAGYERDRTAAEPGSFALRGGTLDLWLPLAAQPYRLEWTGQTITEILRLPRPGRPGRPAQLAQIVLTPIKPIPAPTQAALTAHLVDYLHLASATVILLETTPLPDTNRFVPLGGTTLRLNPFHSQFGASPLNLEFGSPPLYQQRYELLTGDLRDWLRQGWQVTIATHQSEQLAELLTGAGLLSAHVNRANRDQADQSIRLLALDHPTSRAVRGLRKADSLQLLLTDHELFGATVEAVRPHGREAKSIDWDFLGKLAPGDFVVHLDHGVGIFSGLSRQTVDGQGHEYFLLTYDQGDKLYLPVEHADRLTKYYGDEHPKLHRLHGGNWQQVTRRVREDTLRLAQELLKLYASRQVSSAPLLTGPHPLEQEVADSFAYQVTVDQAKALDEVYADLGRPQPMDRLICGDVGFGKTEVAIRAAARAVASGYQVAVLCPTTILAQQHFDTFIERLPIGKARVDLLSRFRRADQQEASVLAINSGLVDVAIGTHRLLSKDIHFPKLGLVIIDEEQRFGVRHKEQLKALRQNAHVLTLTATPIPRTLHFSLSGLRDLTTITTPPRGRLSIQTAIQPFDEQLVREALETELARQGQVYYLYNKVETIDSAAQFLQRLAPTARIGIAHGQLPEDELAAVMHRFDVGEVDALVCSTIIENGLDVPNANTLIVENATQFGLSELYQLRGRIGRSDRQAYAYFLYHRQKLIGLAAERLHALQEADRLGSGFQLSMRDMEIRGVGNLLGHEQHGKVSAIGLSLYTRMLHQAVEEIRSGVSAIPTSAVRLDLPLTVHLPTELEPDEGERLKLYQQLANFLDVAALREFGANLLQTGRVRGLADALLQPLRNLVTMLAIKLYCQQAGITGITTTTVASPLVGEQRRLTVSFDRTLPYDVVGQLVQQQPGWEFTTTELKVKLEALGDDWLDKLVSALKLFADRQVQQ